MVEATRYRPALDGLRAIAVAAVITYHLGLPWLPGGFLGVDLFFVLSGYLITGLLLDAWDGYWSIDLASFWARRARRLLPALLVMVAVVALAVRHWEPASTWALRQGDLVSALFYYANWQMILSGQSYFDATAAPSPLGHMWSLAIEEQFYLLWPLLVLVLLRRRLRFSVVVGLLAALAAASATAMVLLSAPGDPTRAYAGTDARAQQLVIGALLCLLVRRQPHRGRDRRPGRSARVVGAVAAVAALGLLAGVSDSGSFYYRGGATLVALVCAALIWSVERLPRAALARGLSLGALCWVGQLSYGLYLWHLPVIRLLPAAAPGLPAGARGAVAVAVTVGLAAASYYAVERPIRLGRRRLMPAAPRHVAGSAAVAVAACAAVVLASTSWATGLQAQQIRAANDLAGAGAGGGGGGGGTGVGTCPDETPICPRLPAQPGQRTFAVVGDSVARSLDPGFLDLARRTGWGYVLAAHNGCGLTDLVNIDGAQPKPFMTACARATPGRLRQLLDAYHPQLVISLSRWELITHLSRDGARVEPMSGPWADDVHAALRGFAQTVVGSGATLAMLAVLPLAPANPACVADPDAAACGSTPDALTAATNELYARVRDEVTGVTVVSTQDIVCPAQRCRPAVGGMLVRFDGQHFTEDGARWFVRQLQPRLP